MLIFCYFKLVFVILSFQIILNGADSRGYEK